MLRGVNKRIIEVNETGSDYFEKALFFVKNNVDFDDLKLENEAKRVISCYFENEQGSERVGFLRYREQKKKNNRKLVWLLCAFFSAAVLVGLAFSLLF